MLDEPVLMPMLGTAAAHEQANADDEADNRAAHDRVGQTVPQGPASPTLGGSGKPPHERDAERIDAVAHEAEHRREQGERGEHGRGDDEDRAGRQALEDVHGNDQQPEQRHDDDHAADEHGAAGRGARDGDGLNRVAASTALLAVARDDEE